MPTSSESAVKDTAPPVPFEITDTFAVALSEAVTRSRAMMDSSLAAVAEESRTFIEEMAKDGAAAMQRLQDCKSPFEILAVEQDWLAARSKAYLSAGLKWLEAAKAAASPGAEPDAPLPE